MVDFSGKTLRLIQKACKGKEHLKLTIGYLSDNHSVIKVYGGSGELDSSEKYTYEIGSITKTFTTSLLSKHAYENRLSLNDSIQKYIEGLEESKYYPSLLRLATHASGYAAILPLNNLGYFKLVLDLISGSGDMNRNNPLDMDLKKMKMLIEINELKDRDYPWKYSNFGLSLIGYVLGIVSGKGYWDEMSNLIRNEFELPNTYLGTLNNNLKGFDRKNNDCGNWQWSKENLMAPAGAISSTAEDLLEYARINMYNEKPYLSYCHERHGKGTRTHEMGLGWLRSKKNKNLLFHGGGTGCFSTFLAFDKEKKTAVVVLANYRLGLNEEEKIGFSLLEGL